MSEIIKPTNEEMIELMQSYSIKNKVDVISSIDTVEEQGISLDVDQGFIEMFEDKYPGVSIDESLQTFFEDALGNFMNQVKNDPEFAEEVKEFHDKRQASE